MQTKGRIDSLDGLRGWAALVVVFYHLLPAFLIPEAKQPKWIIFPTDGALAVYVFFVVSGFSLAIGYVRTGDRRVLLTLAVRRYLRLSIPVLVSCFLTYLMMSANLNNAPHAAQLLGRTNWPAKSFQFQESLRGVFEFAAFGVYFDYVPALSYNPVLWTMSVEMAGSFIVFALLALLGTSRLRWPLFAALWLAFSVVQSPFSAFIAGVAMAEMHDSPFMIRVRMTKWSVFGGMAIVVCVAYVATFHRYLYAHTTALSVLGAALVMAFCTSERLAEWLSTRVSRFMGAISFPLYLTHIPVICTVGAMLWLHLRDDEVKAIVVTTAVVVPLCLALAWLFSPVERFAVSSSRRFSRAVLSRTISGRAP
ncbi:MULTISPECIES: acyltransferase [unclassified Caballeronia]|uniref:acyltransferase family protein n=1 Tax=unclassified Caballeronia TaxID=2646786 RepID=UPI00286420C1|nr:MULTISPECIES: acyltransferase [unclassified Caballeronia]MDR5737679.1 acyltransferase [Caballeronia sp. LZ016]MDR5809784.1 acyltransferase [Caballeronia sp. LZ019]